MENSNFIEEKIWNNLVNCGQLARNTKTARSQRGRHVVGSVVVVLRASSPQYEDGTVTGMGHMVGSVVVVLRASSPQYLDATVADGARYVVGCVVVVLRAGSPQYLNVTVTEGSTWWEVLLWYCGL